MLKNIWLLGRLGLLHYLILSQRRLLHYSLRLFNQIRYLHLQILILLELPQMRLR